MYSTGPITEKNGNLHKIISTNIYITTPTFNKIFQSTVTQQKRELITYMYITQIMQQILAEFYYRCAFLLTLFKS